MKGPLLAWDTIHPSVYREAAIPVRRAIATTRAHGALRYQCPVTGSFVLVTDEATLESLERPLGRVRCVGCGEIHLLTHDIRTESAPDGTPLTQR